MYVVLLLKVVVRILDGEIPANINEKEIGALQYTSEHVTSLEELVKAQQRNWYQRT